MVRVSKLFEGIFAFFSPKPKSEQVSFCRALEIVSLESSVVEKEFVAFATAKFSEVKHLLSRLSAGAKALESQEIDLGEGNKAYRQIIVTSQKNLARQLQGLSQKLSPPTVFDAKSAILYSEKSLDGISSLMPYWKNIALAKLMLKDEVKEIGILLKELGDSLQAIRDKATKGGHSELGMVIAISDELASAESELAILSKKAALAKDSVSGAELKLASAKNLLDSKRASGEAKLFAELQAKAAEIRSKKEAIVSRLNSTIAPVEKVFKRLHSMQGVLLQRESDVLGLLLSSPEVAILLDPRGEAAKSVFSKAESLVLSGQIVLKDSERQKRIEAIKALLSSDFFSDYFWELNKLEAEAKQVEKQASSLLVSSELSLLERSLESAGSEVVSCRREFGIVEKKLHEAGQRLATLRVEFASRFNGFFEGKFELGEFENRRVQPSHRAMVGGTNPDY